MSPLQSIGICLRDGRVSLPWVYLVLFGFIAIRQQLSPVELILISIMAVGYIVERVIDSKANQKELAEIRDSHNVRLMALEEVAEKTKNLPKEIENVHVQLNKAATSIAMMRG